MTKLKDFLQIDTFSKYKVGIESIENDFIQSGYEMFLWKSSKEEWECMAYASQKAQNHVHIPNKMIISFIDFITQQNKNDIIYIFPENYSSNFCIIKEVCKNAKKFYVIGNIFPEDETTHYIAIFDKKNIESIILMNHLVYSSYMSDVLGGYKLFGYSLSYYSSFCADNNHQYLLKRPNDIMHFLNFQTRKDTNPYIIYEVRKKIEYIVKKYYNDEFELFMDLNYLLLPCLQNLFLDAINIEKSMGIYDWKKQKELIKKDLIIKGVINSKWKNEKSLYLLVNKYYPDSIFQYRPTWLLPQSLDIFIPSINVAIEYQGIQHYQPVEFFGGEEAFKHRIELDKRKQEICKLNGLIVIEWEYTLELTHEILKRKFKEFGITIK